MPRLLASAPALSLLAVAAFDLATGGRAVGLGLVVIAPLLASRLHGVRSTGVHALLAVLVGGALGAASDQYDPSRLGDQLVRLTTIVAVGAIAVVAADARVRREHRLAAVLRVADAAQQAILPPIPPRLGPLRLAASYDSAAREAAIGGDLFAAVPSPFGPRILIGDVRGKGLEAVRLASTVLGSFRERAHDREELPGLLEDLDRAVTRAAGDEDFVTAVVAQLRGDRLVVVNAGHPPPVLLRAGEAVPLAAEQVSAPLGLGALCTTVELDLLPGDRVLLHTDGLAEARRPADGRFLPLDAAVPACLGSGELAEGLARLRRTVLDWVGGHLGDDVALLVLEHSPTAGTADPRPAR